ncbi:PIG-L deacetylase family protein [Bacillus sp. USDA818B3_A]|uniref:PIG-L deacetylase family protein n=1 Tax=Bacillus sp. USDA818B3_A TaxID=2698834 RepID=UPI001367AB78|nr:PIG-L family deacetylase [Bacillus sp. USDA818B3_A]
MLLANIKKPILRLIPFIEGNEILIKKIEYFRGLYRYPNKMVGRKRLNTFNNNKVDALVFAAHPDDDVLGLGTILYRHRLNGDNIVIVFVTNGTARNGESWHIKKSVSKEISEIRYKEAVKALSLINISEENIVCLGYPDKGSQRYLKNISSDILNLIRNLNPHQIYAHCIEGGHGDHDFTSFVVKSICRKIEYTNLFEWAEYNPKQQLGTHDIKFLSTLKSKSQETKIVISKEERRIKKEMLACHTSQNVEKHFLQGEAIRKADTSNFEWELYEHCQFPNSKIKTIVKDYKKKLSKRNTRVVL